MYLKKLEVQGFKSLADKIELQFNQGVSVIVGPNGCGKSNLADATRWVLGEQSIKSLRGAKMEDVIFSGSDKRKQVGMAEVSITLDNSTSVFPLDYSEITVTRRVYRSGESEYLINKTPSRLKDIHELFMDTGIGREGYSIIGQGKIEEILSAKSEDRRQIIEEAAGIIKYKSRKLQAVKKLNETEQNLIRIHDIIGELAAQVGPLQEQSKNAKEFLKYKDELVNLEVNLLVNQIDDQKEKLHDINHRDEELKNTLITSETNLRNLESEIEEHKLKGGILDEQISMEQKEVYETGTLIEKKEAEIMVAAERSEGLNTQQSNLASEVLELQEKVENEQSQLAEREGSRTELKHKIKLEDEKLFALETQLTDLEAGIARNHAQAEEKKADIIDLLNEMAGVSNSISSGEIEIQNINRRIRQLEDQRLALDGEYKLALDRGSELDEASKRTSRTIVEIKAAGNNLTAAQRDLGQELDTKRNELTRLKAAWQDKSSRLKALQDLQEGYEGYYRGVKEILLASRKGGLSQGVCGVVAEIIRVPGKYEIAVETALGSAMQNIVTETDHAARTAIEFLKQKKAGRATFLPLNTIRSFSGSDNLDKYRGQAGFLGTAAEIVSCDPKFDRVVQFLLGRVLIVENIQSATELARATKHSLKIVTLDGDIINPGGSMTGGSYQKGNSGLLGRVREIKEATSQKSELAEHILMLENDLRQVQSAFEAHTGKLTELNNKLQELTVRQSAQEKDAEVICQDKNRIESTKMLIFEEEQSLQQEIQQVHQKRSTLQAMLSGLKVKDLQIRQEIEQAKGLESDRENERLQLQEEVTGVKIGLAALQQEMSNYTTVLNRVQDTIRDLEGQILRKQNQLEDFSGQQCTLQSTIQQLQLEVMVLNEQKGSKEDVLNCLRNERQAAAAQIAQQEGAVKGLIREITGMKDQKHSSDIRRARLEFEIENSLQKLAEEFQMSYEQAVLRKTEIFNRKEMNLRIKVLRDAITAIGNVNLGAIEEYERVSERYEFLSGQYKDLDKAKESLYTVIQEMDQIMLKKFSKAFTEINENFGQVFARLFGGGKAQLILTNGEDLLETGIEIVAQPPGKKNQHLSLLSGGEKALTAISLLFAILMTKPSPFCILDEIEAALDEVNVDRFADYLKELSTDTQFIVITHRKGTMEAADVLFGVTMDESGVSKLVSMKMGA